MVCLVWCLCGRSRTATMLCHVVLFNKASRRKERCTTLIECGHGVAGAQAYDSSLETIEDVSTATVRPAVLDAEWVKASKM